MMVNGPLPAQQQNALGMGQPAHSAPPKSAGYELKYNLDDIYSLAYTLIMAWEIEYTDEFSDWWNGLTAEEQDSIADSVYVLQESGPALTRPQADTIHGSKYANMREL